MLFRRALRISVPIFRYSHPFSFRCVQNLSTESPIKVCAELPKGSGATDGSLEVNHRTHAVATHSVRLPGISDQKPILQLNISAYKFVSLPDAHQLRDRLQAAAAELQLRGTVLLAEEGINLFLAGKEKDVREWVSRLRADPRFSDVDPKESFSATVPFRKLMVKVKREIIRMNMPAIRPERGRAPALPPATLARWLKRGRDDDGVPVIMLDTRNGFEVDEGAFDGAIDWRLRKFSDFPEALRAHADELAGRTVVSYCTGGIRCEKAAIVAQQMGLQRVWQLDGGILKYLETTDAPGWHGQCFVFDERRGVDAQLRAQADGNCAGEPPAEASFRPLADTRTASRSTA